MVTVVFAGSAQFNVAVNPGFNAASVDAKGPQPLSEVAPKFLMMTVADVADVAVQLEILAV